MRVLGAEDDDKYSVLSTKCWRRCESVPCYVEEACGAKPGQGGRGRSSVYYKVCGVGTLGVPMLSLPNDTLCCIG